MLCTIYEYFWGLEMRECVCYNCKYEGCGFEVFKINIQKYIILYLYHSFIHTVRYKVSCINEYMPTLQMGNIRNNSTKNYNKRLNIYYDTMVLWLYIQYTL